MGGSYFLEGFYNFGGCKDPILSGEVDLDGLSLSGVVLLNKDETEIEGRIVFRDDNTHLAFLTLPHAKLEKSVYEYERKTGIRRNYLTRKKPLPQSSPHEGYYAGTEKYNFPLHLSKEFDKRPFLKTLDDRECWISKQGYKDVFLSFSKQPIPPSSPLNILRNFFVLSNPVQHKVQGTYQFRGEEVPFLGRIEVENNSFIGRITERNREREVDIEGRIEMKNGKPAISFRKIYGELLSDVLYRLEKNDGNDNVAGTYAGGWKTKDSTVRIGRAYEPGIGEVVTVQELGKLKNRATLTLTL